MVRGKPTIEHVLLEFIEFLGEVDTILLAHNALLDLGFLAMGLTRLGSAFPPHYLFDTLDMTRRLYPTWPSRCNTLGRAHSSLSRAGKREKVRATHAHAHRQGHLQALGLDTIDRGIVGQDEHVPTRNVRSDYVHLEPVARLSLIGQDEVAKGLHAFGREPCASG